MSKSKAIVYLVDDDPSFLTSVSRLLRASGFTVSAFSSPEEFLEKIETPIDTIACVISDLDMPGRSGLDLQEALIQAGHPMPMIFLTGKGDIPSTVRAMRQGAEDFLTKTAPKEHLLTAVNRAMARAGREMAERTRTLELRSRLETLSPREREVLARVVQGKPNKVIAAELAIHERTVKLHRTSITTKLRVYSVAELTSLTREVGMPTMP